MRRHLTQVCKQALADGGASTSGRSGLALSAASTGRQCWVFTVGQAAGQAAASGSGGVAAAAAGAATAAGLGGRRGPPSGLRQLTITLRNYKQLSKLRLSLLVVATSAAGYAAGSKEDINWAGMGWTSLGTMLASSSANALNQVYERVNDSMMKRTMNRPLPTGRMSVAHALAFAAVTGVGGVWLLAEKINLTTAGLGAANIALYAGVYTPLKQISIVNTWVGAVVGAVPPLMGWAAATGGLDAGAAILGAGLYFWQMPHFMALAWLCRADYAAGGYRMLSLIDATGRRTAACAFRNCLYLFPLGALATWLGVTSPYFAYESAFITGGMMLTAAKFYGAPTNANARLLFRASLLHLPLFMAAFLLHRLPNTNDDKAGLLMLNARRLGLGQPLDPQELLGALAAGTHSPGQLESEDKSLARQALSTLTRVRLSFPPLPFVPALPMEVKLSCPSKASCEKGGSEETEAERDGEQQQQKQE